MWNTRQQEVMGVFCFIGYIHKFNRKFAHAKTTKQFKDKLRHLGTEIFLIPTTELSIKNNNTLNKIVKLLINSIAQTVAKWTPLVQQTCLLDCCT